MNPLRIASMFVCLSVIASTPLVAQQTQTKDTNQQMLNKLIAKATKATMDNWSTDHWEHSSVRKSSKDGDAMSYVNAIYWNFLAGQRLGDQEAAKRSIAHYQYMVKHWWNPKKKRFNTGYDFLFNAHIIISIAQSLRDAPDVIPADVQADMKERLRGMCAFLPTYTTALKNTNDDLRANNQDAFAAYALILAAKVLGDEKIAAYAMVKFQSVLDCVDGPFWREGGVDVGYQLVGEPGMMAAADLLWDKLDDHQKKQVSDLSLLGRMVNGFTFETCRAPSRFFQDSRTVSVGLLNHVQHPLLASDAYDRLEKLCAQAFSNWELYDLSPLCFHGALVNNYDALLKTVREPDAISWGGMGTQMMRLDESRKENTGMTRMMLSDPTGMVIIGGDHTHQNPRQAFKKFGATEPFTEFDPGGLRYLGRKQHLYVWEDAHDGLPAITTNQGKLKRALIDAKSFVGFAASQYQVAQKLTDEQGKSRQITQLFVPVQGMLLIITQAAQGEKLTGLNYAIPVPATDTQLSGQTVTVHQQRLNNKQSVALTVASLVGNIPVIRDEKVEPYFRAKIKIDSPKFAPPSSLNVVEIPLGNDSISVIALVPDCDASQWRQQQVQTKLTNDALAINFKTPAHQQVHVDLARHEISELAGVANPVVGLSQVRVVRDGKLIGFTVNGQTLTRDKQTYFKAQKPILVSYQQLSKGSILEVDGPAQLGTFGASKARSLIDNQQVDLPHTQVHHTGRWWLN